MGDGKDEVDDQCAERLPERRACRRRGPTTFGEARDQGVVGDDQRDDRDHGRHGPEQQSPVAVQFAQRRLDRVRHR
jgi:hypothetical protein